MGQEASFTFTTPLNVNLVDIKGVEHLFVEGDISTNDIDLVDDSMTKNCQESMQKQILERSMKLDLEHEAFKGDTHEEKEINKTKIPAGKLIDAVVKKLGKDRYSTRVKGEINPHNPNYKDTKGNLLDGYLDAFSVAFLPIDISYEKKNGKTIRMLNDVRLLNVALTGNPCNTKAQLTEVFTKSLDALEDYKKLKELDPSLESHLVVKNKDKKENPFSYVWDKMMFGEALSKSELKLLKAALDVVGNKGTQATLAKELYEKLESGVKLSYKEYYLFRDLIEMEHQETESPVMGSGYAKNKSYSTSSLARRNQLNKNQNSKMTDEPNENVDPVDAAAADGGDASPADGEGADPGEDNESGDAEQKVLFSKMSVDMKALAEKYDVVSKENVAMKEDMKAISSNLAKIAEALENPIHKSQGVQKTDAEAKAKNDALGKSVDPLSLF